VGYETLKLCSGRSAFESIPSPKLDLDLPSVRSRLEAAGVAVVDARVMLIFRLEHEVTLSRDGRILIKTADPKAADRVFQELDRIARLTTAPARDAPG
jgi:hypothetical protein